MFLVRVHLALFVKHVERRELHPLVVQTEIFRLFSLRILKMYYHAIYVPPIVQPQKNTNNHK